MTYDGLELQARNVTLWCEHRWDPSGKKTASTSTPPNSGKKPANSMGSGKSNFLTKARVKQLQKDQTASNTTTEPPTPTPQSPIWSSLHGGQQMLMVTLSKEKTIQVHVPTEIGPRSPTLAECKTIIVEQQETNHKQARELLKLRTDLKEAIISQKWNQNSFLVGKSYGRTDAGHVKLPARAPVQPEKVSLPSLRPNINSGVADRRRRQQAILRGRMGRRDFY
ncbi:hypothetical protein QZH41_020787 [Actinostola sp. cb2023]|nr:hypothetical protein QZH41_020787 [Actinostola sp. cb2023]